MGRNQQANLADIKTFGSNAINELRLNYSRYVDIYAAPQGTSKTAADYGINGYAITGAQGLPHIGVTGLTGLIGLPAATFYTTADTYEVLEGFSKVLGSHNMNFGGEFGWSQWNSQYVPSGGFTFNGNETGNAVADFSWARRFSYASPVLSMTSQTHVSADSMLRTAGTLDRTLL